MALFFLALQILVVGLTTGAIYALIALGYTMVYGIIELINFAHGDIFMIGTFVSIAIFGLLGIGTNSQPTGWWLVAVLVITCLGAMLACAVLGVVIERVAYRPLRNSPRIAPLISAIGVSLILEDVGKLWKGIEYITFPQIFPDKDKSGADNDQHRRYTGNRGSGYIDDSSAMDGHQHTHRTCYACCGAGS